MGFHLSSILANVYPFLGSQASGRLARTSLQMRGLVYQNRTIDRLVELIFENYQVIACSVPVNRVREVFLTRFPLLFLGETHSQDSHRYLNSHIINLLWQDRAALFVEGSTGIVEYWKRSQENPGILKYMRADIKERAVTWDDNQSIIRSDNTYSEFAKKLVLITQSFIEFFQESKFSYRLLIEYLEGSFDDEFKQLILDDSPTINLLKLKDKNITVKEKEDFKKQIQKEIAHSLFKLLREENTQLFKEMLKEGVIREDSLNKFIQLIYGSCLALFVGGRLHVQSQKVIQHLEALKKNNPHHYLLLNPQNTLTSLSVAKSFREKMGINILPADESMQRTSHLTDLIVKKDPLSKGERDFLEPILMSFDPKNMGSRENHFGLWVSICFKLLENY